MLSDPLSLTIGSTTFSLVRTESTGTLDKGINSTYEDASGLIVMTVSQQVTKANRYRHSVRIVEKKVVTNPLDSTNDYDQSTFALSIDRPAFGFSVDDIKALVAGGITFMSPTLVGMLYGKQS